jgi:membrane protein YdbS with pleckstrin-like domain
MSSSTPTAPRRARTAVDWLRKLAAILLVLSSVTVGIVGLMFATQGRWWGAALIAVTPFGIWLATRVTPEGGTTGYFDKNV